MSDDGITLSDEMIHNIMHTVMDHDPAAQQDRRSIDVEGHAVALRLALDGDDPPAL